jgi:hypothetical protein
MYFTDAHFHTQKEIKEEFTNAGFSSLIQLLLKVSVANAKFYGKME